MADLSALRLAMMRERSVGGVIMKYKECYAALAQAGHAPEEILETHKAMWWVVRIMRCVEGPEIAAKFTTLLNEYPIPQLQY
jgi:hypothetical protein